MPEISTQRMIRTAGGRMVPAQNSFGPKAVLKRFLVVLQYFDGDRDAVEELGELIADLERVRNRDVDILIFARADAQPFSQLARTRLESKFNKVMFERCRRRDAKGYPWGANAMFSDLVMLMAQTKPYKDDYYAFINLESDCCPLHPGWIGELSKAFMDAIEDDKYAVGFICQAPVVHLNGVAVYSPDIYLRVGSGKLSGGNPRVGFDTHHAKNLLPFATSTPFIKLDFQRPTITGDDLFDPVLGVEPALHHGVKDGSAREAVRARHISLTDVKEVARKTVFTFYMRTPNTNPEDDSRRLSIWREGWRSRGWNPVVLTHRDASRNTTYTRLKTAVEKLPVVIERELATSRFLRWLALESMGGGFIVDSELLPGRFSPADLDRSVATVLTKPDDHGIHAAVVDKATVTRFIESIIGYDAQPEDITDKKPNVTDFTVWRNMENAGIKPMIYEFGTDDYHRAKLVHFGAEAVSRATKGERQTTAMERYLRGN